MNKPFEPTPERIERMCKQIRDKRSETRNYISLHNTSIENATRERAEWHKTVVFIPGSRKDVNE